MTEHKWSIETQITSWEATRTTLVITTGTTLAVLPFPDPDQVDQLEEGQSGQQTLLLGTNTEVIELPTEAEILNSTLNVPFVDKAVNEVKIEQLSFEDGVAREQDEWGPGTETRARIVGYPILDGVPHVLLRFLSAGVGNPVETLTLYNAQMEPVDFIDYMDTVSFWQYFGSYFEEVEMRGNALLATKRDLDDPSYGVTSTYLWNGKNYELSDLVYFDASRTWRAPDMEVLQSVYDQVAAGNEATVEGYFAPEAIRFDLNGSEDYLAELFDTTNRGFYFETGGEVKSCTLIGSETGSHTVMFANSAYLEARDSRNQPGDFECSIVTPALLMGGDDSEDPGLYKWTVRTDEEGNPQIISVYAYNP